MRPHRWQPTRLPRLWDSPGKNTGVGCHFLLQCMKVKSEREVAQSYPTLSDPRDCSLAGSFVHRIFQARVLEWGAIAFSVVFITRVLLNALFCVYRMEYYTVLQKSKGILHAHVQNNFQGKIRKMQGLQTMLWFCGEDTSVCTCISVHRLQLGTDTEERCSLYTFSLKKFSNSHENVIY